MRYLFGECELDTATFELRRRQGVVGLPRRLFDVLLYLVERQGQVVPKFELIEACWPDSEVSEASLSHAIMELRRALGDRVDAPVYIETVRGRGFRMVAEVQRVEAQEASAQAPPSEAAWPSLLRLSTAAPEAKFVGRERVLAMLVGLVDEALAGRGGAALLGGEPGIGKTRTLVELEVRAGARAGQAVNLRSIERERAPLRPWAELVVRLIERGATAPPGLPAELLAEAGPRAAGRAWAELSKGEQFAAREALGAWLAEAARPQGLLVLWDDVHWADEASLTLLEHVGRGSQGTRLALVCSYNSAEARRLPRLAAALGTLARLAPQRSALLRGLARPEAAELLASALGAPPSDEQLDSLLRKTGGNPQFLLASTAAARARGGPASIPASSLAMGSGVAAAVDKHINLLPAEALGVVQAAAVLGDSFSLSVLALVVERSEAELLGALSEATRAGLLLETPGALGWYSFEHPLVRGSLYRRWAGADRAALHRAAAEAIEQISGGKNPLLWPSLSHHLLRAGEVSLQARGAEVALNAARSALLRGEQGAAAMLCRRALGAQIEAPLRFQLWATLIEAYELSGAPEEAAKARAQAASLAALLGAEAEAQLAEIEQRIASWG